MKTMLKETIEYARFVGHRCVQDRCLMVAGSLTYTSLLALVPLFAVTIALTAHVPLVRDFILVIKAFIEKNLLPDVGTRMVSIYMEQFAQNAASLTAIGLLIILATAIALMFTIDGAFNDIWRTRRPRAWWRRFAAYLAVLTLGPLLIGASISLTSYVVHLTSGFDRVLSMLDDLLLKVASFGLTALALVVAYRSVPNRYVPTRHALIGGVVAALLFELVKHLFVAYIVRVPTYKLVYGAFASVPIFLLWLFCCWMVVLIGAEVAATLSYFGQAPALPSARAQQPSMRLREATLLVDALASSPGPIAFNALRLRASIPINTAEDVMHDLLEARIVSRTETDCFLLARPRSAIGEQELRDAMGAG